MSCLSCLLLLKALLYFTNKSQYKSNYARNSVIAFHAWRRCCLWWQIGKELHVFLLYWSYNYLKLWIFQWHFYLVKLTEKHKSGQWKGVIQVNIKTALTKEYMTHVIEWNKGFWGTGQKWEQSWHKVIMFQSLGAYMPQVEVPKTFTWSRWLGWSDGYGKGLEQWCLVKYSQNVTRLKVTWPMSSLFFKFQKLDF